MFFKIFGDDQGEDLKSNGFSGVLAVYSL